MRAWTCNRQREGQLSVQKWNVWQIIQIAMRCKQAYRSKQKTQTLLQDQSFGNGTIVRTLYKKPRGLLPCTWMLHSEKHPGTRLFPSSYTVSWPRRLGKPLQLYRNQHQKPKQSGMAYYLTAGDGAEWLPWSDHRKPARRCWLQHCEWC